MSDKKILTGEINIKGVSDTAPEQSVPLDVAISAKAVYDVCQDIMSMIESYGVTPVHEVNLKVTNDLEEQRVLINNNDATIEELNALLVGRYVIINNEADLNQTDLNILNETISNIDTKVNKSLANLNALDLLINSDVPIEYFDLVLGGDSDYYYPVWWNFNDIDPCQILLKYNDIGSGEGLFISMLGIGCGLDQTQPNSLHINEFTDRGNILAKLISPKMYGYKEVSPSSPGFIVNGFCGIYLRGGRTYKMYVEHSDTKQMILDHVNLGQVLNQTIEVDGITYVMPQLTIEELNTIPPDEYLLNENAINRIKITITRDEALSLGGTSPICNNIEQLIVSTGVESDKNGSLLQISYYSTAESNGGLDIGRVIGGCQNYLSQPSGTKENQQNIISTAVDTVSGVNLSNNFALGGAASNGMNDILINIGGMGGNDAFLRLVVSTGIEMDVNDTLPVDICYQGCASNGINDISVTTGNNSGNKNIWTKIISTDTSMSHTATLIYNLMYTRSVSNREKDVAIHFGGHVVQNFFGRSIVSTGTAALSIGNMSTDVGGGGAGHNGVGDIGICFGGRNTAGGANYLTNIQQAIIPTGSSVTNKGSLSSPRMGQGFCSNS
ncbi:MAG: hypothetical protein GY804_09005 [Alphaproteobacteria bacterium]|nr:hypothetical protein [Alphaproteobacteria bacterium]